MGLRTGHRIACALALFAAGARASATFISGADLSLLDYFQTNGVVYRDDGRAGDAMAILKAHGLNCVRLRLFTSSTAQAQANPYNYINNLDYTLPLAVRVKQAGLKFILDFHYSDTWADPSHQTKPAAWTKLRFAQLVDEMRAYNSNCIAAFKAADAMPDFVQVGNEITGGMLWPDGKVPGTNAAVQWPKLAQLMNAAIHGIQDASGAQMPKIIVHIDRGGDWQTTRWFFDNLRQQNVPFDIIGESYYPYWHGPLTNLSTCLSNTAVRYDKPVLVAETDFPWIYSTNLWGIPASTNGQVQYVAALAQILKSVPDGLGAGIVWWGAEYQIPSANEGGFGARSLFDNHGCVLPVADALGALAGPVRLGANLSPLGLTLEWPLSGAGMTLTSVTNLSPFAAWQPITNAPRNTGALFDVTLPIGPDAARFFRLEQN